MKMIKLGSITLGGVLAFALLLTLILPTPSSALTLNRQLQIGMSGSDVSALQAFLAADASVYPEGLVTGYFGPLTQAAVARYQTKVGLPSVGRVGPQTLAVLASASTPSGVGQSAPAISGVTVNRSDTSATIQWNTSVGASAVVYYDTRPLTMIEAGPTSDVVISGTANLVHTDLRTTHSASFSGLSRNTTYYYLIYVRDASGNVSVTWPATFQTS